jgi:hypothetical protein
VETAVGLVRTYPKPRGYFVLTGLQVRVAAGRGYRGVTNLDVIAVRFPHPPHDLSRADPALDKSGNGEM